MTISDDDLEDLLTVLDIGRQSWITAHWGSGRVSTPNRMRT